MPTIRVALSSIKPNPDNPRIIKDDKFRKLVESIRSFPEMLELRPIVVNADNVVLGGNMRLKACQAAGLTEVPIILASGLTDEQQREFIIKDNVGFGEWDWDTLANEWDADLLDQWGLDVPVVEKEEGGLTDPDEVPEPPADPITKLGDLIILGRHRLLCGDSTDEANATLLLDGGRPAMLMTDPPYGLNRNLARARGRDWRLANDNDSAGKMYLALAHFGEIAERYVWGQWNTWQNLTDALGIPDNCIVWHKTQMGMGHGYRHQHEFCAYFGKKSFPSQGDVWVASRDHSGLHPTMKPIDLLKRALENSSEDGDLIVDPFLGSGSTLIASELTGRRCYGIELEPKYCDVIVKRWQAFTGQQAIHSVTGEAFDSMANSRNKTG
jgi:hypothetical protein